MNSYWILGRQSVFEIVKNSKKKILEIIIAENKISENLPSYFNQYKKLIKYKNKSFFNKIKQGDFPDQGFAIKILDQTKPTVSDYIKIEKNFIVLNDINDPRNIGSIIRSCAAFGIKNIIIENQFYNSSNQVIQKSSSGGIEYVNVIPVSNVGNALRTLKKEGYKIFSFSNHLKSRIIKKKFWNEYNAFVFGSESTGIKRKILEFSDEIVKIQTSDAMPSLNVSNAVAAFLSIYTILNN